MSKHISIDKLNEHLFKAIEMLKNNKDPNASENEKIDVETAKTIADISKVVVEGYKVKIQALNILSKADNPKSVKQTMIDAGIETSSKLLIENHKQ